MLEEEKENDTNTHFDCPISGDSMTDPRVTPSGQSVDKTSLDSDAKIRELNERYYYCPFSNKFFLKTAAIINHALLAAKKEYEFLESEKRLDDYYHSLEENAPLFLGLLCPLTLAPLKNPVITESGITYEKAAIEKHIDEKGTDPFNGKTLEKNKLIPNIHLRNVIEALSQRHDALVLEDSTREKLKFVLNAQSIRAHQEEAKRIETLRLQEEKQAQEEKAAQEQAQIKIKRLKTAVFFSLSGIINAGVYSAFLSFDVFYRNQCSVKSYGNPLRVADNYMAINSLFPRSQSQKEQETFQEPLFFKTITTIMPEKMIDFSAKHCRQDLINHFIGYHGQRPLMDFLEKDDATYHNKQQKLVAMVPGLLLNYVHERAGEKTVTYHANVIGLIMQHTRLQDYHHAYQARLKRYAIDTTIRKISDTKLLQEHKQSGRKKQGLTQKNKRKIREAQRYARHLLTFLNRTLETMQGLSPLLLSAATPNPEMLEFLFDLKADPREHQNMLLHEALRYHNTQAVALLIRHGVDPNVLLPNGRTALTHTLVEEKFEHQDPQSSAIARIITQTLLENEAKASLQDAHGRVPLQMVYKAARGIASVMNTASRLLSHNLSSTTASTLKHTMQLNELILRDIEHIISQLCLHGADTNLMVTPATPAAQTTYYHENQALHKQYQLKQGWMSAYTTGQTLLHHATTDCRLRFIAMLLLNYNANPNTQDTAGNTPLLTAVQTPCNTPDNHNYFSQVAFINTLLRHGAHPHVMNHQGLSPLSATLAQQDSAAIDVLLKYGARVNAKNNHGLSPLQVAIKNNDTASVAVILHYNPDLSVTDGGFAEECSLFRLVIAHARNMQMITLLAAHHYDFWAKHKKTGTTPLQDAINSPSEIQYEVIDYLLERNVNPRFGENNIDNHAPLNPVNTFTYAAIKAPDTLPIFNKQDYFLTEAEKRDVARYHQHQTAGRSTHKS